jgi:hypothetical protein
MRDIGLKGITRYSSRGSFSFLTLKPYSIRGDKSSGGAGNRASLRRVKTRDTSKEIAGMDRIDRIKKEDESSAALRFPSCLSCPSLLKPAFSFSMIGVS